MLNILLSFSLCSQVITFDVGSSGTRVYLYNYSDPSDVSTFGVETYIKDDGNPAPVYFYVNNPLANCYDNDSCVNYIFSGLMTNILKYVKDQETTNVLVLCTAGMRLLNETAQVSILDSSFKYFKDFYPNFILNRSDFRVIHGYEEALFAWIAVNRLLSSFRNNTEIPILEIGGASAQIAFEANHSLLEEFLFNVSIGDNSFLVFAHSFLGKGLNEAIATVIENSGEDEFSSCIITGATHKVKNETITGNANYTECYDLFVKYVYKRNDTCRGFPCFIDDIPIPEKFQKVFTPGVPTYTAPFLNFTDEINFSDYKERTIILADQTYDQLSQQHPNNDFLNLSFAEAIISIAFVQGALDNTSVAVIKAPSTINGLEPQWTFGGVITRLSSSVHFSNPTDESLSMSKGMVALLVISIIVIVAIVVVFIAFLIIRCKKKDDEYGAMI